MNRSVALTILLAGFLTTAQAHFMSNLFPRKDFAHATYGKSSAVHHILISGTKSDYKEAFVSRILDSLKADSIYISVIPLKDLKKTLVQNYQAIFLIDVCIAWAEENKVLDFVRKNKNYKGFVVYTTAGDPNGCGSKSFPAGIDAISSASDAAKVPELLKTILGMLHNKMSQ